MTATADASGGRVKAKILIVDDHPVVRQGLIQLINQERDLVVCGEAGDSHGTLNAIETLRPDLAIVDISLPGVDGLELIKAIRARYTELPVLVLSMYDESLYAGRALRAGAKGYVMKDMGAENLVTAIRKVLSGEHYVSEGIASKILRQFAAGRKEGIASPIDLLTDRELEVFRGIGDGLSTRQIAENLHLSIKTVESYRAHIKEKLQLETSTEMVKHAVQWVQTEGGG
jgi:DNA-binding NarL/FixJ family response regulator